MHTHSLSVSVSGESHGQVFSFGQESFLRQEDCVSQTVLPRAPQGAAGKHTEITVSLNIFEGSPTIPGICQMLVGPLPQQDQC